MSSLWTPGGEHQVPRNSPQNPQAPPDAAEEFDDFPSFDELTPEQQQQAREMAAELAEARQRIAETPAEEVVANHVMGLYELAAIHLSTQPPAPAEARIAIDAMAAVLSGLRGRLGENEGVLANALQQLQLAYVEVVRATTADDRTDAEEPDADDETAHDDTADEAG